MFETSILLWYNGIVPIWCTPFHIPCGIHGEKMCKVWTPGTLWKTLPAAPFFSTGLSTPKSAALPWKILLFHSANIPYYDDYEVL